MMAARELMLKLNVDGRQVQSLDVRLPRFDAGALLCGRSAGEAAALLPKVLGVCAQAQAAAALGALGRAGGQPLSATQAAGQALMVRLESVQESLRTLCLGLPETLRPAALTADFARLWRDGMALLVRWRGGVDADGRPLGGDDATALRTLRREALSLVQGWETFCAQWLYGVPVAAWRGMEEHEEHDREGREGKSMGSAPLPMLAWYRRMLASPVWTALGRATLEPVPLEAVRTAVLPWRALVDKPYEASAWRRVQDDARLSAVVARWGNNMAARLIVRLVDVAQTLQALRRGVDQATDDAVDESDTAQVFRAAVPVAANAGGVGQGMAEVECARGVLVHHAQWQDSRIVAYDVYAPTDWNLHRDGALSSLIGAPADDREQLRTQVSWLVQMLDPCVAFTVEVCDA